jgi:Zn-dependent protease
MPCRGVAATLFGHHETQSKGRSVSTQLTAILLVVAAHELGHALAVLAVGERPALKLTRHGPGIAWDGGEHSARARAFVSASGPLVNLALIAPLWALGWHFGGLASAELAVFSLIPTKRSDGGRALRAIRARG